MNFSNRDLNSAAALLGGIIAVAAVIILCKVLALPNTDVRITGADPKNAIEAIKLIKDWGVWMAGIQTATLAATGILAKDGVLSFKFGKFHVWALLWTVLFNTAALFFSAWLLTSTSSAMLTVNSDCCKTEIDFYLWPLFAYLKWPDPWLTIGYVALVNHWLWALGILFFGVLTISVAFSRIYQQPPALVQSPIPPDDFVSVLVSALKQDTSRSADLASETPLVGGVASEGSIRSP